MQHAEMVALIRAGVQREDGRGGVWADLGAGTGNFTWALAELLGAGATIHAIDRDAKAVRALGERIEREPPAATILPQQRDVTGSLALPPLDGVLAANLLHFVRGQEELLRRLRGLVAPGGRLLVIEYEQSLPIPWVPHPLPYRRLAALAEAAGWRELREVGRRVSPSSGQAMYAASAVSRDPSRT